MKNLKFILLFLYQILAIISERRNINTLAVDNPIPPQTFEVGERIIFTIPNNTFSGDNYILRACLSNNQPLPDTLTLKFKFPVIKTILHGLEGILSVVVDNWYAYIVGIFQNRKELRIFDIQLVDNPIMKGSVNFSDSTSKFRDMIVKNGFVYISERYKIFIIDVSDSDFPKLTNFCDVPYIYTAQKICHFEKNYCFYVY